MVRRTILMDTSLLLPRMLAMAEDRVLDLKYDLQKPNRSPAMNPCSPARQGKDLDDTTGLMATLRSLSILILIHLHLRRRLCRQMLL